jgi:F-type H+-transporting ATPase subunit b
MTAPSQAVQALHNVSVAQVVAEHEDTAFGLAAPGWVALSMIVVILIMVWKGVPKLIAGGLDKKIATIRQQLDEATALRAEAEAMRADLQKKAADAHKEAQGIVEHAKIEAAQLVAQAKIDADTLIERRGKMAEDKIAAAERGAIAEIRAKTASASAAAAAQIIAERHDAKADRKLVEKTISSLN